MFINLIICNYMIYSTYKKVWRENFKLKSVDNNILISSYFSKE